MFVYDKFIITIREVDFSRAHRVGQYNPRRDRPIMVAFQSYNTAEDIIKQGHVKTLTLVYHGITQQKLTVHGKLSGLNSKGGNHRIPQPR